MANRISGNVYILDSQMGGAALTVGSAAWLHNSLISAVGFWSSTTAGIMELAYLANTNDVVILITPDGPAGTTGYSTHRFLGNVRFEELTTKTLTAGTGFLYLS